MNFASGSQAGDTLQTPRGYFHIVLRDLCVCTRAWALPVHASAHTDANPVTLTCIPLCAHTLLYAHMSVCTHPTHSHSHMHTALCAHTLLYTDILVHTHPHTFTLACIHPCAHTYSYTVTLLCAHVQTHLCVYTLLYTHIPVCTRTPLHSRSCVHMYTHTCVYTHSSTLMFLCAHTHPHIQTPMCTHACVYT